MNIILNNPKFVAFQSFFYLFISIVGWCVSAKYQSEKASSKNKPKNVADAAPDDSANEIAKREFDLL